MAVGVKKLCEITIFYTNATSLGDFLASKSKSLHSRNIISKNSIAFSAKKSLKIKKMIKNLIFDFSTIFNQEKSNLQAALA